MVLALLSGAPLVIVSHISERIMSLMGAMWMISVPCGCHALGKWAIGARVSTQLVPVLLPEAPSLAL